MKKSDKLLSAFLVTSLVVPNGIPIYAADEKDIGDVVQDETPMTQEMPAETEEPAAKDMPVQPQEEPVEQVQPQEETNPVEQEAPVEETKPQEELTEEQKTAEEKALGEKEALPEADSLDVVYVSADGNNETGKGTQEAPVATLTKALEYAKDGATIQLLSDFVLNKAVRVNDKSITFVGNGHVISRGSITTVSDNQRSWYNPAMFEINNWTTSASHTLTLNGVIVDDRGVAAGTQYVQATSNQDNTKVVQDGIVASYTTNTIHLTGGTQLRNYGGMSAVCITGGANLVMDDASIVDTMDIARGHSDKGNGQVGAVWIQGGVFNMHGGASIGGATTMNGRAVYVDGGTANLGGTIQNLKGSSSMWFGAEGVAIHVRNSGIATLSGTITGIRPAGATGGDTNVAIRNISSNFISTANSKITDVKNMPVLYAHYSKDIVGGIVEDCSFDYLFRATYNDMTFSETARIQNNTCAVPMGAVNAVVYSTNGAKYTMKGKMINNKVTRAFYIISHEGGPAQLIQEPGSIISGNGSGTGVYINASSSKFIMNGGEISNFGIGVKCRGKTNAPGTFIMNGGVLKNNGQGLYYDLCDGSTNSIVELKGGTIETNVNDHIAMKRGMTDDTHEYLYVNHGILKGRPSISTYFSTIYLDKDYPDLQLGLVKTEAVSTLKEKVKEQKPTWKVVNNDALWLKPTTSTLHMQIKRPSATDTTGLFVAYIPLDAQGMIAEGAEVKLKEVLNTPVIDVTFEDLKPGTSYAIGLVNNDIYKASMNAKVYLGGGSTDNETYTTGLPGLHIDGIQSIQSISINGKKTNYINQKKAYDALNALFEVKYLDENGKEIKNDGNPGMYTAKVSLKNPSQTIKVNENEIHIVDGQLTVRHTTKAEALTDGSATIDIHKEIAQPVKQPQAKVDKSTTLYRGTIPVYDRDGISLLTDDILDGSQKLLEEKAKDYLKTESETVMNQFEWRYLDLVDAKNGNEVITGAATIYLPYPKGLDANSEIRVLRMNGLDREYGMNKTSMDEAIAASTVQEMQINKLDHDIEVTVGPDEMGVFAVNWTVSKKNVRVHYIDQETNKEIEPTLTVGFEEGTAFDVKEVANKAISGYTHVKVKGTVSGEQLTEDLDVYVYYKNQAPEILGAKDQTITVGDAFDPLKGVTVNDAEDGKLELTKDNFVSYVDTSKVGKYTVTYKIVDSRGKEATKTIHITVNPKAGLINKAPTIDAKDQTIKLGDAFDPMKGVTAKDAEDGNLTEKISAKSNVNCNKVGVYEVTYTVMDSKGATTTKTIQVTVQAKATVKPEQNKPNKQDGSNASVQTNVKVFTTMGIATALVGILTFFKRKNR